MKYQTIKKKIFIFLLTILIVFIVYKVSAGNESVLDIETNIDDEIVIKTSTEIPTVNSMKVYICGEITNEGVYNMKNEDRLEDLISIAGGFTDNASKENLNLARKLRDGEKIKIYSIDDSINKNEDIYIGIDKINNMNIEELKKIPGIGDKIGQEILDYIFKNGSFIEYEELLLIEGIGESKLKNIIEFVE